MVAWPAGSAEDDVPLAAEVCDARSAGGDFEPLKLPRKRAARGFVDPTAHRGADRTSDALVTITGASRPSLAAT